MVKGNVLTAAEDAIIDHQTVPLTEHVAVYASPSEGQRLERRADQEYGCTVEAIGQRV